MWSDIHDLVLVLHGSWRWVVLGVLPATIVVALIGWRRRSPFSPWGRTAGALTIAALDFQLLLGLILYGTSPLVRMAWRDISSAMTQHELRFFSVEHITGMVVAIALAHLGFALSKRAGDDAAQYRRLLIWYSISAVILFGSVPWWRPWFRALLPPA